MAQTDVAGQLGTFAADPSRILHRLMSILDISDAELATRLGVSRQTVHARRTGRTQMSLDNIREVAAAIDPAGGPIDPMIFLGSPVEAIQWIIDHRPELFRWLAA